MGEKPTEADETASKEVSGLDSETERGTINTSKSNTFREADAGGEGIAIGEEGLQKAAGGQEPPEPAEASNLNSSKSNLQ